MNPRRICLVSTLHLSYNPRLLKEADALHEAGYDVRVVALRQEADKAAWDAKLMANRAWRLQPMNVCRDNFPGRVRWFVGALRQKLYQRSGFLRSLADGLENTFNRHFPEMCRLAAREAADLFIAHNLQALPVAACAARKWQARLGFDAEDFHRGEISEADAGKTFQRGLIREVEQKYIPRCDYLGAASDGIGDAYVAALGVKKPVTILNVFPLSERAGGTPPEELPRERRGPGLSLYWYSQVIGPDRGLEDAVQAVALLGSGLQLHIRGAWGGGYEKVFREQTKALGVEDRVHVVLPAPPEQLVERAAQHDVGLALEPGNRPNNRLAASNKLFSYFLAGLAIAATDVSGQRGIMASAPEAGFLFSPGDARSLADRLRSWRDEPGKLSAAKARSKALGETRFCWDREKDKLLLAVGEALNRKHAIEVSPHPV